MYSNSNRILNILIIRGKLYAHDFFERSFPPFKSLIIPLEASRKTRKIKRKNNKTYKSRAQSANYSRWDFACLFVIKKFPVEKFNSLKVLSYNIECSRNVSMKKPFSMSLIGIAIRAYVIMRFVWRKRNRLYFFFVYSQLRKRYRFSWWDFGNMSEGSLECLRYEKGQVCQIFVVHFRNEISKNTIYKHILIDQKSNLY